MADAFADLLDRVTALESKPITVADLPLTGIQAALENTIEVGKFVVTQPQIQTATLKNGWVAQAGGRVAPSYFITNELVVHVFGEADGTAATNVSAFVLPVGMRPKTTTEMTLSYYTGAVYAVGVATVQADGQVLLRGNNTALVNNAYFHLNFFFHAEQ